MTITIDDDDIGRIREAMLKLNGKEPPFWEIYSFIQNAIGGAIESLCTEAEMLGEKP